ncbi:S8 family peptidase [Alteribacter natronophilus]|uniref:S8 family peptidase n=1 Tax=Alteribacter natronophilus TaxID=2583810 RepID=UPI00110DB848|nr:S8 family peptidase [Alteribacter natronophilus]TMW73521.1 peptidase S8 [Alteribacter natronophilus]
MRRIIRLSAFFSLALLAVLAVWFFSDHQEQDLAGQRSELQGQMDEIFAEDVTYTVSMFLDKMEDQLIEWAAHNEKESDLSALERDIYEHPHYEGFALVYGNGDVTKVGKVTDNPQEKLKKEKKEGVWISDPFIEKGTEKLLMGTKDGDVWCIGEMDLSFVSSFINELALITDDNGQFFIGSGNLGVNFDPSEAEYPYVKKTVPGIDWEVFVHSDPEVKEKDPYKEGEVVVRLKEGVDAREWGRERGLHLLDQDGQDCVYRDSARTTDRILGDLSRDGEVYFIEPNFKVEKQTTYHQKRSSSALKEKPSVIEPQEQQAGEPNDELYDPYQWNLEQITASEGWDISSGSEEITIAIIDSGVDPEHPDLEARIADGYNAFEDNGHFYDENGHGTHVAGVAAAVTNNVEGIAGVSWNNPILAVKALDANAEGNAFSIAEAIRWSVDNGARVINLSLGDTNDSQVMRDAVRYAYEQDVVMIAASGNENVATPMYPAAYPEVLTVAALDHEGNRAVFSNFGEHVDVSAPGEHIPSTYVNNEYVAMSGTSMASPHVAGLAGLILSINPDLSNEEVYDIIRNSCDDIGQNGFDAYTGHGVINVANALSMTAGE